MSRAKLEDWGRSFHAQVEAFKAYWLKCRQDNIDEGYPDDEWPMEMEEQEWEAEFLSYLDAVQGLDNIEKPTVH